MYSKVKLLGHPIHPMLVAYPIALYSVTLLAYIISAALGEPLAGGDHFWYHAAVAANIGGVIMAGVTALPGFIDWAIGIPSESPAKAHGLIHMLLNVAALGLFVINWIIHHNGDSVSNRGWGIVLAAIGVLCTVGAGFFGWTMIQDDHVGVRLSGDQAA